MFEEIEKDFERVKAKVQAKKEFSVLPRAPCKVVNGVVPLHRIHANICDQYGGVPEMQYRTQHIESPYLQLEGGKNIVTIWSMEQTFLEEMKMKIVIL